MISQSQAPGDQHSTSQVTEFLSTPMSLRGRNGDDHFRDEAWMGCQAGRTSFPTKRCVTWAILSVPQSYEGPWRTTSKPLMVHLEKPRLHRISSWPSPEPLGMLEPGQEQVPQGAQAWLSFATGLGAIQLAQGHDLDPNWVIWFLSLCLLL